MPVIALQGIRGGVGTTSVTAALAWSLQQLGESVLVIDLAPDNLLRLHFNMDIRSQRGWARAELDGIDWKNGAMRYCDGLDFLPFGGLSANEQLAIHQPEHDTVAYWHNLLTQLCASKQYRWILLDMPIGNTPLIQQQLALADGVFLLLNPDANCHIRLHQQTIPVGCHFLINRYSSASSLQQDLHQLWLQTLKGVLPLVIHHDEAMAEALMAKQPIGEYLPASLAADEILTLANWCLLNLQDTPA